MLNNSQIRHASYMMMNGALKCYFMNVENKISKCEQCVPLPFMYISNSFNIRH